MAELSLEIIWKHAKFTPQTFIKLQKSSLWIINQNWILNNNNSQTPTQSIHPTQPTPFLAQLQSQPTIPLILLPPPSQTVKLLPPGPLHKLPPISTNHRPEPPPTTCSIIITHPHLPTPTSHQALNATTPPPLSKQSKFPLLSFGAKNRFKGWDQFRDNQRPRLIGKWSESFKKP